MSSGAVQVQLQPPRLAPFDPWSRFQDPARASYLGTQGLDEGAQDDAQALQKLRKTIKAVAPEATEVISYQVPAFKLHGRPLVSYAAFKDHCSFFPMSTTVVEALGEELKPYVAARGTLHFTPDKPIPAALIRKVKARIDESEAQGRR
jgi:uncharacterized protein YdhG (YjbR/CyaY superfamily)